MSYVDDLTGNVNLIDSIGEITSVKTSGDTVVINAIGSATYVKVQGKLGVGQTAADSGVKNVFVNGESVVDEKGNANIEIPEQKEETDPTVPEYVKNITEEDINKWNNPEIPEPDNNYNNATNKPKINGVELKGDLSTELLKLVYSKLLNLPKINGKELVGDLTTEDLGIEAIGGVKGVEVNDDNVVDANGVAKISVPRKMSQLENDSGFLTALTTALVYYYTKTEVDKKIEELPLGTVINIKDTFYFGKKFQDNDVYNANAVNSSVDWTVQALLGALQAEYFVSINVVVTPQADGTFKITSIDGDYGDIAMAHDIEGSVRCVCQIAQTNINVVLDLALLDNNYAYFTKTMKVNLGAGEMKYLIGLYVYSNSNVTPKIIIDTLQ